MATGIHLKQQLDTMLEELKAVGKDISKTVGARQRYTQQKAENDMVFKELDLLDDEAKVFKLIGPALVRQDLVEAKSNVSKRLDYINGELDRLDSQLKNLSGKRSDKENEVLKLQKLMQRMQQDAAAAAASS